MAWRTSHCHELGGKTPLEYAKTPNMDWMARNGACGMLFTIPDDFEAGSDIANMSILGYAPEKYYTGRGPLEALSMGVDLSPADVAYRCNLVTVENGIMADFSAGHISSAERERHFSRRSQKRFLKLRSGQVSVTATCSLFRMGKGSESTPPHDIVGKRIGEYLPKGGDADLLKRCMEKSREVFADHPVNNARMKAGKPPATGIWPWSGGHKPAFPSFATEIWQERRDDLGSRSPQRDSPMCRDGGHHRSRSNRISRHRLCSKGRYALDAIKHLDFLYLHIEAPDEAGHLGSIEEKVKAIERVDEVVGTILEKFRWGCRGAPRSSDPDPDQDPFTGSGSLRCCRERKG